MSPESGGGDQSCTAIRLRALDGSPLADLRVRGMVQATARAIAERHGLEVLRLACDDVSIEAVLRCGRIEAVGFAAELRRLTTAWYREKTGSATLWGEAPRAPHDQDETWLGDVWTPEDEEGEGWKQR